MTQQVRPAYRCRYPRTPQRVVHSTPDDTAVDGRSHSQPAQHEYLRSIGPGSTLPQIVCQHRPDRGRKRQERSVPSLAGSHPYGGVAPANVVEPQLDNLTGPKPQPAHTKDDCSVSQTTHRRRVQRSNQLFETARVQMAHKTGWAMRQHRHRVFQPVLTQPRCTQEPQE